MSEWLQPFLLAFIPLFIAIDPVGIVPIFLGITHEARRERLVKITNQATWTAAVVSVGFMFLGKLIFQALGISVADFQIAGGLILLVIATKDLLSMNAKAVLANDDIGVVPLGMPLVAGPATITTLLITIDAVGLIPTLVSLLVNLVLVNLAFRYSRKLTNLMGVTGMRAMAKIVAMLLAAIAVHMIRLGLGHQ